MPKQLRADSFNSPRIIGLTPSVIDEWACGRARQTELIASREALGSRTKRSSANAAHRRQRVGSALGHWQSGQRLAPDTAPAHVFVLSAAGARGQTSAAEISEGAAPDELRLVRQRLQKVRRQRLSSKFVAFKLPQSAGNRRPTRPLRLKRVGPSGARALNVRRNRYAEL